MNNNIKILEWYAKNGVTEITYKTKKAKTQIQSEAPRIRLKTTEQDTNKLFKAPTKARTLADNSKTIAELRNNLDACDECLLKKTATNTVFSDGQQNAQIMLVGEAPGANEDLEGRPFCGDSGKLLDKVFLSIDINRAKNLYITNAIFWRPPGNRKPTDLELQYCLPFLEKHIALIKPKMLILAGSTASVALLNNSTPISKQRQQTFAYQNRYLEKSIDTIVMFHPSYLLRQPSQKKSAWQDMLFIQDLIIKNKISI
jgi:uracil-DNA glycosylase